MPRLLVIGLRSRKLRLVIVLRSRKLRSASAISVAKQRHAGMHGRRRSLMNGRLVRRHTVKNRHGSAGNRSEWRQKRGAKTACARKPSVSGIKDRRPSGKPIEKLKDAVAVVVHRHDLIKNNALDIPMKEHRLGPP